MKVILSSLLILVSASFLSAQNWVDGKFGKGISIMAKDSSYSMKFSTRMQNRYEGSIDLDPSGNDYSDKIYLRRARLKFDGFVHNPKFVYKIEIDVVNGFVLDAVAKWNFAGNFTLWAGQTKMPGNRERVISSQKLQFVDRSMLNSRFTLDRDKGLQLRHHFKVGNVVFREIAAISLGEGLNYKGSSEGHNYVARLEILPFGKFASKGDYFGSDLKRESKPKLALGFTYDYNQRALLSRGQKGSAISLGSDLASIQADAMFKFKGISLMAEYADRTVAVGETILLDSENEVIENYYTGSAVNLSLGYLFKCNWEVATRFTTVTPESITGENNINEYTIGLSKYVVGHSLKFQTDLSYRVEDGKNDRIIPRMQFEVAF